MSATDEWKIKHGIDPSFPVNHNGLLMRQQELASHEMDWCLGCDNHLPVREMKLITRLDDPYVQIHDGPSDYIPTSKRIRMCQQCFKDNYETDEAN